MDSLISKVQSLWKTVSDAVIDVAELIWEMLGDLFTGGLLMAQRKPMIYGAPLAGEDSLDTKIKMLAVSERSYIITETMTVQGTDGPYATISGLELLISGTDTMNIYTKDNTKVCTIQSSRGSNGFVVYRGTGEKIGKIEKIDEDYAFYAEDDSTEANELTALTRKPVYKLSGDFINRRFVMRTTHSKYFNATVAKVKKQLIAFPAFDHYTIRIAPGMDPILVLACMCVIDEDLDDDIKQMAVDLSIKAAKKAFSYINPFG